NSKSILRTTRRYEMLYLWFRSRMSSGTGLRNLRFAVLVFT
ncbi:hypothetical protein CEXT_322091, partial [Caerostris extrusa]